MHCQEFREMADSYLSGELLIETNHEVLRHLENCAACRRELAAHRALRTHLRAAVKNAPDARANPIFTRRLEADLREIALRPTVWTKIKSGAFLSSPILATTVAACLLLGVLFGFNRLRDSSFSPAAENSAALQNKANQPAENSRPTETGAAQITKIAWREMTREAVGDHENCALNFRLKEDPITLDEASKKYGKFNKGLDKTVIASLHEVFAGKNSAKNDGEQIEFLEAHSCVFEGRRFAHIVLRRQKQTISVLVTDAADLPDDDDGGELTNQSNPTMNAASFQANHHAVFIVSDLTETENMTLARTIAPAVRRHIRETEAGA